jgi:hypothetical protein
MVCALGGLGAPRAQVPPQRGLTGVEGLVRAYDAIFDADFANVPARLTQACGPAPEEACQLLGAVALWWRIRLDPLDRTRDRDFRARVEAAIASTANWTVREPSRAEAWFYLAGAYGARAQWRVLRGQRLAAARDGGRIKDALERAAALDPDLADASFGLGLYHYYADVAPAALKVLRWLLLLPGGDRVRGLEEMRRAQRAGLLLRGEADYQLHLIYLWYEKQPERALDLVRTLHARHPRNPYFRALIADIQHAYLGDTAASLASWQALLDAARTGGVAEPAIAAAHARRGLARVRAAHGAARR